MKITIIHNVYLKNPYINETIGYNLGALESAKANFQYIIFNDNGDESIKENIESYLVDSRVQYIYSPINFGHRMCPGGWIGAIPHIDVDTILIHRTDQDDVMTEEFYSKSITEFEKDPELYFTFTNAIKTDETLAPVSWLCNPEWTPDYSKSLDRFKDWFGVDQNGKQGVTRANNNIPGLGVIYKKILHDEIGPPDIDNFRGACDFEYWSRFLFYEKKGKYINEPLWLYRQGKNGEIGEFSAGNEIINGKPNRGYWQQLHIKAIQEKYTKLWNEKINI